MTMLQYFFFCSFRYNYGQAYNRDTGYFTAQYAGLYYFSATLSPSGANSEVYFDLFVNDIQVYSWLMRPIGLKSIKFTVHCSQSSLFTVHCSGTHF